MTLPGIEDLLSAPGEPLKRSVSVVVWSGDGDRLLAVRRPPDDEELPGAWGLPAASLRGDEGWRDAARRVGPEKLGVELEVGARLREGEARRADHLLRMRLFEARIVEGRPSVPRDDPRVTQYVEWAWAAPDRLREAAERGSLCSRLCLDHLAEGG